MGQAEHEIICGDLEDGDGFRLAEGTDAAWVRTLFLRRPAKDFRWYMTDDVLPAVAGKPGSKFANPARIVQRTREYVVIRQTGGTHPVAANRNGVAL